MKVRIKWEYGQWWAYLNGEKESHICTTNLPSMFRIIKFIFKGA